MSLVSHAPVIRGVSPRACAPQGVGGFRRSALVVAIASAVGVAGPAMLPRSAIAAPLEETLTGVNIEVISAVAGVTAHEMSSPDGVLLTVDGSSSIVASGAGGTDTAAVRILNSGPVSVTLDTAALSAESSTNFATALRIEDNVGAVTVDATALDLSATAGMLATGMHVGAYDYEEFGFPTHTYYDASLSLLDSTLAVQGADVAFGIELIGAATDLLITGGTLSATATSSMAVGVTTFASDAATATLDGAAITATGGDFVDGVSLYGVTTASLSLLGGTSVVATSGATGQSVTGTRVFGSGSATVLLDDASIVAGGNGTVMALQTQTSANDAVTAVSLDMAAVLSATSADGAATGLDMIAGGGVGGTLTLDLSGASEIHASGAGVTNGVWIHNVGQAIDVNIDTASLSAESSTNFATALRIEDNVGAVTVNATALDLSTPAGVLATGMHIGAYDYDEFGFPTYTNYDASLSLLDSTLAVQGADVAFGIELIGAATDLLITGGTLSATATSSMAVGVTAFATDAATATLDGTTITATGGDFVEGVSMYGVTTASLSLLGGTSVVATNGATGLSATGARVTGGGSTTVQLDDASIVAGGNGSVMALQTQTSGDDAVALVSLATATVLSATSVDGEATGLDMTASGGVGGTLTLDLSGASEIHASGAGVTNGAWIHNVGQAIDVNIDTASLSADSSTNFATALRIEDNAGAVTVNATALDLSTPAGMLATGIHLGAYDYDEFGFPTHTYYDASLSLLDSTLAVQGTDVAFGIELIGAATDLSITGGTLSATATSSMAVGVTAFATDAATATLDGTTITATGGDFVEGVSMYGATASLSLLGGASVEATGTVYATAARLSGSDASVTLTGGSSLYADALASDSSVGLWLSALSSTVSIDDTSSITGGAANAAGSDNAAITVASGSATLTNAGLVYSPATGLQVQAGVDAEFFNLASGTLQGLDYAASGNIALDNLGLVAGRLDVQTYVAQADSVSRAYIDAATPMLASGVAYWNVVGTATLAAGANIDVVLAPDFRETLRSDGSTPDYLLLRAGNLVADPATLQLSSGPLVSVEFLDGLPAGELGIHIDVLDCLEANLTPNGQAACLAADAGGGFVFDYNGDPDGWAPSASGMTRGAVRAATSQLASAIRQRLAGGSLGSGDEIDPRYMLWIDARGMSASQDARNGIAGFEADGQLATIGIDAGVGESLRAGLAVTAAGSEATEESGTGEAESEATMISLYGHWPSAAGDFELVLGAGDWNTVASRVAGSEHINADYDSAQLGAGLWWSKPLGQRWQFVPQLAATYRQLDIDAHDETGDGTPTSQALSIARQVYDEGEVGAGFRLAYAFATGRGGTLSPGIELMQWHELVSEETQLAAGFITGSPRFSAQGMAPAEDRTTAAVSLEYLAGNGLRVEIRAESDFADDYEGQALAGKLEYRF